MRITSLQLFAVLLLLGGFVIAAHAEDVKTMPSALPQVVEPKMPCKDCLEHSAGMRPMGLPDNSRQVVALSDGGVIVLIGNNLIKYDKNLKLTAQVELPSAAGAHPSGYKHKMPGAHKACPMMGANAMGDKTKPMQK